VPSDLLLDVVRLTNVFTYLLTYLQLLVVLALDPSYWYCNPKTYFKHVNSMHWYQINTLL